MVDFEVNLWFTSVMIDKAIELVGLSGLAKALGVSPQAVWKWQRSGRVPAERCIAIESATDGRVTRYALRPDVYGPAPIRPPKKVA